MNDFFEKHGSTIIIGLLILTVMIIAYYRESFISADAVASRQSNNQVRSDNEVDKTWNLKEFEKSVASLNEKAA